jgi:hypothetical protein
VRSYWKILRLAAIPVFRVFVARCSGVNAPQFVLARLMQADPARAHPEAAPPAGELRPEVAQL